MILEGILIGSILTNGLNLIIYNHYKNRKEAPRTTTERVVEKEQRLKDCVKDNNE